MPKTNEKLVLPLIITRGGVLYPNVPSSIEAGRQMSLNAIFASKDGSDSLIFVTSQIDPNIENPTFENIYKIGTLCRLVSISDKQSILKCRLDVLEKVKIESINESEKGFYYASAETISEKKCDPTINKTIMDNLGKLLEEVPTLMVDMPKHILNTLSKTNSAKTMCYALATVLDMSVEQKQKALETDNVEELVDMVAYALDVFKQKQNIEKDLQEAVRKSTEKSQKDYFLREKLKAIKKELGDDGEDSHDPDKILEKVNSNPYPDYIKAKVKSEIKKYEMMPQGSLESALVQSYLDVLLSVPWFQKTEDNDDLDNVEKILNEDHYGLQEPKKRILEYLAVKKLTGNLKSPILCFYGPPGCGKTSLGKSIARALGRKFFKASLGGISDEAEIRGHRRTYVGSMPGRIIQGMRKVGVTNPVFLLDEIDKLASSYKGDPASAMLEVLDPEQNTAFNDNYLEEPYDLSDVLFICTANYLENIPAPLRDRLELIEVNSYTEYEKLQIAKTHLVEKQILLNGLKPELVSFTHGALLYIIRRYTRESGVRELERKIASCLRKVAVAIVKDPSIKHIEISEDKVKEYLGLEIFDNTKKEGSPQVGVVTGLAYTQYGGGILPIEVNYFKGKGGLVLTGHLGDVMKESCSIAFDYVKANASKYSIQNELFLENDLHIHVPEGATPKDGPSAGIAITLAIISCLSKTPVNPDVAMTGEITLRGNALPIGGLREKSLAALRSGIKTIIVPKMNKKDVSELPQEVKDNLDIKFMDTVDDAIKFALVKND